MNQLKLYLSQIQQSFVVPEIELVMDPEIQAKFEECQAAGKDLKADDFEGRQNDRAFMGRLEKVVDRWVRKITSVTTLEHDPSQGPVIEEKNFWLAIE